MMYSGKVTGTNRGKGGSMHITDITKGILGVSPIVGAAHAVGAGLFAKVPGTKQVAVAFFAVERARAGGGPTLLECTTLRGRQDRP